MGKNVVVWLDGTGNEVKATSVTNVFKIVELLRLEDPTTQVAFYDPGVGTFAATGAWTAPARERFNRRPDRHACPSRWINQPFPQPTQ